MLYMPGDPSTHALSRDHFIELLEQCEDMEYKRVLVCFDKDKISPKTAGIVRTFKCIGFNVLPVDGYPSFLKESSKTLFSLLYEL